jgi:3-oxoacyl-[acyl-carrier protein] reductase
MDLQLKGKSAVVTGGTRGIGRAIANLFADEGANVAVCARNAEEVGTAVAALGAKGVQAWGAVVDVADGPALKGFVAQAGERLGGIDAFVSNVTGASVDPGEAGWKAMFDVDVMGAVRAYEAAQPFLEQAAAAKGDAAFIMIASIAAAESADGPSAYGAMKSALIHYAKGLARANAAKRVRANVVSPGTVFFEDGAWGRVKAQMPALFETMIGRNPTGRMATPEEVAAATVFLASPLSAFTTGTNFVIDGAISHRVNF